MKQFLNLLLGLVLISVLAFCSCTRTSSVPPPTSEPIGADTLIPGDSLAPAPVRLRQQPEQPVVRRRLFGLLPAKTTPVIAQTVPGRCKKCPITINVVAGNQTNQQVDKKGTLQGDGSSNIDKNKGTSGTGSGTVANQPQATNAAVTHGDNNSTDQKALPPEPKPSLWQRFKWPLAGLGTIALLVGGIYLFAPASGAGLFLAGLLKRKKSTDTIA